MKDIFNLVIMPTMRMMFLLMVIGMVLGSILLFANAFFEVFKEAPYMMPIVLFGGLVGSILLWGKK
ncbi:hypothetical protein MMG00_12120 [Ignatzschineria rhizosphaerae]|uniref:Uncharacterized protein n=1 Tax=Ignatzschineria rhizosphaerae TaxID=2923279 RepID=A0ABY3X2D7_9GAMM|nr:hypothetical protein [Ignatzschineria rhizosphaerae]UNM95931.1 hypothetical protein MMG00_12120 [Ignatzschineria rhizosphaerae]